MKAQKFILIDDNDAFRNAFCTLLKTQYNATILNEAANEAEISTINNWIKADIIFMDVMMPEKSGIQLTKELIWKYGKLKIIAVTMHFDKVYLTSLIEAGFKGCIFKDNLVDQIEEALTVVGDDKLYFPNNILFDYNKQHKL